MGALARGDRVRRCRRGSRVLGRDLGGRAGYDAFGFLIFLLVQGPLLATRAQTVGKMLLQVRIADLEGRRAPFAHIVLMRELPGWIANVTMGTGLIYFFVDVLLIFRRDRRCLHDLIAGTQVVIVR